MFPILTPYVPNINTHFLLLLTPYVPNINTHFLLLLTPYVPDINPLCSQLMYIAKEHVVTTTRAAIILLFGLFFGRNFSTIQLRVEGDGT